MPKTETLDLPKIYRSKVEQLYNEHKRVMFYIAVKIVKNDDIAKDIVHSSFLKIIKHIKKIDSLSPEEAKGYIMFIVKNLALDFISNHDYKKTVPLEDHEVYLSSEDSTEKFALLNLEVDNMIEKIDKLDSKYSIAVLHKYVLGYSNEEIAQMLGISVSNAKIRCHRGRLMLVKIISGGVPHE